MEGKNIKLKKSFAVESAARHLGDPLRFRQVCVTLDYNNKNINNNINNNIIIIMIIEKYVMYWTSFERYIEHLMAISSPQGAR
jgi:hypothetical protein